jgi:heme-degrading monooxygenase HmoA
MAVYATLWEFTVDAARQAEFEARYGPDGDWALLFRQAPGYRGTELLRDRSDARRYVTIDRWESLEAFQAFHARFGAEYARLDRECEGLTAREAKIGEFAPVAGEES